MAFLARTIHLVCVGLLAVGVLAGPVHALPRVVCAPGAACGPAGRSDAPPARPDRPSACCSAEAREASADRDERAEAIVPPAATGAMAANAAAVPTPCCILKAAVPADLWAGSPAIVIPPPSPDAIGTLTVDPQLTPTEVAGFRPAGADRPRLPPWRLAPEQGAGPRPPPTD